MNAPDIKAIIAGGAPAMLRVALVGNPNSGKTAMFNALTGSRQKVANYAGVTVERKEGRLTTPNGRPIRILDLPGTYSLRARSPDERVTRDAVLGRLAGESAPDVVVCVADATNLRLVLRLALELKSVGRPCVLALNMIDIAQRQGLEIDTERLSGALGMPVVGTVATRGRGVDILVDAIEQVAAFNLATGADAWSEPSTVGIRALHRNAERILKTCVMPPKRPDTWTGRLDGVLLHPVAGILILLAVLFLMFQAVFTGAQPVMDLITAGFDAISRAVAQALPDGLLKSLICDGIIAGVGSVLVFLPQIMILFLFIIILEDVGYMARAAFLLDKIMGGAGLHGRAFIPLLSSFACAIPGIMATRVIDNRRDRLTTILVAPLVTCSARIPVYTLIISAFIPRRLVFGGLSLQGLVFFGLYALGLVSALAVAWVVRKIFWRGLAEPFLMELPAYKAPDPVNVARNVLQRGQILPAARRHHHPVHDGPDLVPLDRARQAGRRGGAGDQLQFRRHDRSCGPADPRAGGLLLADDRRPDTGHGRPGGRGRRAGHRLRGLRRDRPGPRAGRSPGAAVVARLGAGVSGLVRLRPAVRINSGGGQARDQFLAMAGGDVRLHDGPGLRGGLRHFQRRRGDGGGLTWLRT